VGAGLASVCRSSRSSNSPILVVETIERADDDAGKEVIPMIELMPESTGNIVGIRATGTLTGADHGKVLIPSWRNCSANTEGCGSSFIWMRDLPAGT
jgi:hypothetical protein